MSMIKKGIVDENTPPEDQTVQAHGIPSAEAVQGKQAADDRADDQEAHATTRLAKAAHDACGGKSQI
jgi:hypothetical protein